jgi:ABC-type glycerol-3-phosphate transport system substrate-binding protein
MKISKKIFLTVFCLALVCGAVFATGNRQSSTAATTEVRLWHFPETTNSEKFHSETLAAAVKAKYPNITLRSEMLSWDAGPERMTVAMATRTTPDIIIDNESRLNPGIFAGLAADVSDLRREFASAMYDGFENVGRVNGVYYYVPLSVGGIYNMSVNTDMAKELGVNNLLPADNVHWSYDDFLRLCRAIRDAGRARNIYPLHLWAGSRSSDAVYYSWLMSGGANILNSDHTAMAVNTPEAVRTLSLFKQLIDEGLVPSGYATATDEDAEKPFYSQNIMMNITTAGLVDVVQIPIRARNGEIAFFNTDVYCIPTPDGRANPRVMSWGTGGLSIFRNAGNTTVIEAAKNVVRTLWNDVNLYGERMLGVSGSPINKNVKIDYGNAFITGRADMVASWAGFGDSGAGILEPWWTSWREVFFVELQDFYQGRQTAQQLLTNWTEKGNTVIRNYRP